MHVHREVGKRRVHNDVVIPVSANGEFLDLFLAVFFYVWYSAVRSACPVPDTSA